MMSCGLLRSQRASSAPPAWTSYTKGTHLVSTTKRLCIVPAPGLWLQTGPCMPYGLWLWVATR